MTETSGLRLLSRGDLSQVSLPPADVIKVVETAYRALGQGRSENPAKITVGGVHDHSVAYAMLGRDGDQGVVGMKTSYSFDPDRGREHKRYTTTILLYDDTTGAPIAMLDCARIGALRTPAASALLARECLRPGARSVLVIGTGTQGRQALPHLLAANPKLDRLMLAGTNPDGIEAVRSTLADAEPERSIEVVDDPRAAATEADLVLGAAGPATKIAIESADLAPGATAILLGYGLAPSTLIDADRVIATSAAQMSITGQDLAGPDGRLRGPDVEFPDVITGRVRARTSDSDRIFAYNSGLVLTDIAVAHLLARRAIAEGRGTEVALWA